MKRIIFANRFYWPQQPATGQLLTDLTTGLAAAGWDVTVITSGTGDTGTDSVRRRDGVTICRVWAPTRATATIWGKAMAFLFFWIAAWVTVLRRSRRGTIVVVMTDPPLLSFFLGVAARWRGARLVYWLQDLYPEVLAAVTGHAWINGLRAVRDPLLARADLCVAISQGLKQAIIERVPDARVTVIENWAPTGVAVLSRDAAAVRTFRHEHGWDDHLVLGYSGNLGRVHDLAPLVQVAQLLRSRERLKFVFIGGGPRRTETELQVKALGLTNVSFLDAVPRDRLPAALAAIDVHLVTLRRGCERYVYPSKLYGIVAAGRPLLFVGPEGCEMAHALTAAGFGVAVDNNDPGQLAAAIHRLAADPGELHRLTAAAVAAAPDMGAEPAIARWRAQLDWLDAC